MDTLMTSIASPASLVLNLDLNVAQRLSDLRTWRTKWESEDGRLQQQVANLDPKRRSDVLLGSQIGSLRRELVLQLAQQPIRLDPEEVKRIGFPKLRQHLARQYATLSLADRKLWLVNLSFLLTPTLQALITKLDAIRRYRSFGQMRCFLLGGVSGAGKTSCLNWYAFQHLPTIAPHTQPCAGHQD